MRQAKTGDRVDIHYTGTLPDGTRFDSSEGRAPLSFTLGAGEVIPGFDRAVTGMTVGEKKRVRIAAEDAYGPRDPGLLMEIARSRLPEELEPEVGMTLAAETADGTVIRLVIVELGDEVITVDGNHPLAGRDLTFDLELVAIH